MAWYFLSVQTAKTYYHRVGWLVNTDIYFSEFWGMGSTKSRHQQIWVSGEDLLPSSCASVSSHGRSREGALKGLFPKGTNPIHITKSSRRGQEFLLMWYLPSEWYILCLYYNIACKPFPVKVWNVQKNREIQKKLSSGMFIVESIKKYF